jgi:hypothetical protein
MSKRLFVLITIVLIALFGTVTYYGMQALEPHTYIPTEGPAAAEIKPTEDVKPVPVAALPGLPAPINKPQPPINLTLNSLEPKTSSGPVLTTESEREAYLATSTLRELNPENLFFAPKDARAFPYGKAMFS